MKHNSFTFSNFKAFGPKPQTIKEKPITLVYGKNSVGKSSLLQALLLQSHFLNLPILFRRNSKEYNSIESFGDTLPLGSFVSNIHNKDKSATVEFKHSIINKKEIFGLFFEESIVYLFEKGYLHTFLDHVMQIKDAEKIRPELKKINFSKYIDNPRTIEIVKSIEEFIDKENKDEVSMLVLLSLGFAQQQSIYEHIKSVISYLLNIEEISLTTKISINENSKKYLDFTCELCVKDEKIISIEQINKSVFQSNINVLVNPDSKLIELLNLPKSHLPIDFYPEEFMRIWGNIPGQSQRENLIDVILRYFYPSEKYTQYLGPLRSVLSKKELLFFQSKIFFLSLQALNEKSLTSFNYQKIKNGFLRFYRNNIPSKLRRVVFWLFSIDALVTYLPFLPVIKKFTTFDLKFTIHLNSFLPKKFRFNYKNIDTNENIWRRLAEEHEVLENINSWLAKHKNQVPYMIESTEIKKRTFSTLFKSKSFYQVLFKDKNNMEVYPSEMGTGISQLMPILISLFSAKNLKIFIQQPELHLHPSLQSEIADVFIQSYNNNKNYIFAETHSEHLLLRIMRRMRETSEGTLSDESLRITPDDVALLYIDADEERGTYITELELSEDGELLDPWPGGFFEEGFEERFF